MRYDPMRRTRLLDAAAQVFGREGFETATMAAVADAAGVSKGLPYHYFGSKHALAGAVVAEHLDAVLGVLQHWPAGRAEERLRWFVRSALEHAGANRESYRLFLSLGMQPSTRELVLEEVRVRADRFAWLDETLGGILAELGSADPMTAVRVLRAAVDGMIQYVLMTPGAFPVDEAVEGIVSLHCVVTER